MRHGCHRDFGVVGQRFVVGVGFRPIIARPLSFDGIGLGRSRERVLGWSAYRVGRSFEVEVKVDAA